MTDHSDTQAAAAAVEAATRSPLASAGELPARDAPSMRLEAALLDAARAVQSLRQRLGGEAHRELLARCEALLARAEAAARDRRPYVAWDCLQQIEIERVPALGEEERRAEFALALAQSRGRLSGWRHDAAEALAAVAQGEAPVAVLQALLRNAHAERQEERYRAAVIRQQLPALVTMLLGSVAFFGLWALLGGFDWLARDDVQVTVGMILVSGVLMGYFGGLVSFAFNWLRGSAPLRLPDAPAQRWLALARPAVGGAVAVPIVLFVESGLINLGQLSPALVLALCFFGGFSERWFVGQIERLAAGERR